MKKLTSLHYRLLRIVKNDWQRVLSKNDLDKIGRIKPESWAHFSTASPVIKIVNTEHPKELFSSLSQNLHHERRKPGRMKFFSTAKTELDTVR